MEMVCGLLFCLSTSVCFVGCDVGDSPDVLYRAQPQQRYTAVMEFNAYFCLCCLANVGLYLKVQFFTVVPVLYPNTDR